MKKKIALVIGIGMTCLMFGIPLLNANTLQLTEKLEVVNFLGHGSTDYAYMGTDVTVGDFNADGIDDVAFGAPQEDSKRGIKDVGAVFVFFGKSSLPTLTGTDKIKDGVNQADVVLFGGLENEHAGRKLSSGDYNGDGVDDLLIIAQRRNSFYENTKRYIVFGKTGLSGAITLSSGADVTLPLPAALKMRVSSVCSDDINGDGKYDIIEWDDYGGTGYIFLGKSDWTGEIVPDVVLKSKTGSMIKVMSMAAGDINGDGIADVALGVPEHNIAELGLDLAGIVYVIYGKKTFNAEMEIPTAVNLSIQGEFEKDQVGGTMAVGDVNGDKYADILIGAPQSGLGVSGATGYGKVQIVYGSSSLSTTMDLYEDSDVTLRLSDDVIDRFYTGTAIVAKDITGDGIGDIIISTPSAFFNASPNGWIHVIYGKNTLAKKYEIDKESDLMIFAPEPVDSLSGGWMGSAMAVGNFDGNQSADIAVCAPEGAWSKVSNGWTALILDPASKDSGTCENCGCLTLNQDLSFRIPCIDYMGGTMKLGLTLNLIDPLKYRWSFDMNSVTYDIADGDNSDCLQVGQDLNLNISCAVFQDIKLSFTLLFKTEGYWELDIASLKY
ncbi:MAG: FG-GAP repeat protein [Desulfobacterales bacterium]|nr:FG-GAP repeat protein [Desulfobacterales bacterium]